MPTAGPAAAANPSGQVTAADPDAVRQRSMLASEALSELSRLSTYSPSAVGGGGGPAPLVRRQPAATPAAKVEAAPAAPSERRQRSAADVRSMLTGFTSGVSRARAGEDDGDGEPASLVPGGRPAARPTAVDGPVPGPAHQTRTTDTDARPTDGGPRP
ncbi:hypothetical protein [Aquipuribacter sp. SD81]|uniref:hypothetical protein n=1 Tax=Aquipuribacter sp. SD81 TaxID=3127703 RepID=UPI003017275B